MFVCFAFKYRWMKFEKCMMNDVLASKIMENGVSNDANIMMSSGNKSKVLLREKRRVFSKIFAVTSDITHVFALKSCPDPLSLTSHNSKRPRASS